MKVKGLQITNMLLAGAMTVFAFWVAASLEPGAELPIHWNATGEVDQFATAIVALLLPVGVSLLMGGLFSAIPRLEQTQGRLDAWAPLLRSTWIGVMLLLIFLQLTIAAPGLGWNIGPDLVLVGVGVLLILIGDILPKSRPNFFVGIRTPWTLADTDNWIASHRLGGKIMVIAGCLMVLAAFVQLPTNARIAVILILTSVSALVPVAYSWWLWRDKAG